MFEIGNIVICKSFPKILNGVTRDKDPNMTIDKSYQIIEIHKERQFEELQMLRIMGEKGPAWYWSDYFYSKSEVRKIKLDKLWKRKHITNIH